MSQATPAASTLSYAGPHTSVCPLCRDRPASTKQIYGWPVCKKCFYKFANRRQLAYLIDSIGYAIPSYAIGYGVGYVMVGQGFAQATILTVSVILGAVLASIFAMKDGFGGQSPGKMATNIQVLDERTGQPIRFGKSFKRNAVLLVGVIPVVGGVAQLILVLIIAVQLASGYRLGDRFAGTKAIWKRYANLPMFGGQALICEACGYDLTGNTSGVCPECGAAVSANNTARLASVLPTPS